MVNIPILQIVGYQNSGKTTLMEKIISECTHRKMRIGTIKHHGHGGIPILHQSRKDSWRHQQAGAAISAVEGEGAIELTAASLHIHLETILEIYMGLNVDAILVEGYKHQDFPKVILVKTEEDFSSLTKLTNIQMVISWIPICAVNKDRFKIYSIYEENHYMSWLIHYLRGLHE